MKVAIFVVVVIGLTAPAFAQTAPASPDDWYQLVCGNNGALLKWAVGALSASYVAGLVTDAAKKLPAPLAFVLHLVAGNLRSALSTLTGAPPPSKP